MAEEDWYGPFARLNQWHALAAGAAFIGLYNFISGIFGYDVLSRPWELAGASRFVGGLLWEQIISGALLLLIAGVCYWVARESRRK